MREMKVFLLLIWGILTVASNGKAAVRVDEADVEFKILVDNELEAMRTGKRGLVCQTMVERMDKLTVDTTIKPITNDEKTWHPNDPKGTRSHVVAVDTIMRSGSRKAPTAAVLYLNKLRANPKLSVFKLGTFVHSMATAMDLNMGVFSGDYKVREKRASFFRNAWRDSMSLGYFETSGDVKTHDYQLAKKMGLIIPENKDYFPILDPKNFKPIDPVSVEASPLP
jgi:hypothetical protein